MNLYSAARSGTASPNFFSAWATELVMPTPGSVKVPSKSNKTS